MASAPSAARPSMAICRPTRCRSDCATRFKTPREQPPKKALASSAVARQPCSRGLGWRAASRASEPPLALARFERGQEGGLRNLDLAELAHPLLAGFLLLQK